VRFVLIHGAYHDSWCWHLLRQELLRQGHQVVAPDLPTDDPEAGADGYASLVLKAIEPSGEPAILVGHSLAGLTLPVVAARMPTQLMVFLCALLPVPGLSFDQQGAQMDSGFRASQPPIANADGSTSWPEEGAIETYYHDCEAGLARQAARRLRRQQWRVTQEPTPLTAWPDVAAKYIVASHDRAIAPDYCRQIARDRWHVDPIEIDSGHSPFLSGPVELARLLLAL
jgi:pimeloyl-ACP methyl ester carboxylesterase